MAAGGMGREKVVGRVEYGQTAPKDPLGAVGREALLQKALERAALKGQTTLQTLAMLRPPLSEMLP